MAKNITYLLGAGASAQALPVVSGIQERLVEFRHFLSNEITTVFNSDDGEGFETPDGQDISAELKRLPIVAALDKLIEQNAKHYSIDTYAKKLYLSGNNEEYITLKASLVSFFYYLQIRKQLDKSGYHRSEYGWTTSEIGNLIKTPSVYIHKEHLDKRYDAFFAAILQKEENLLKLPDNVNILSWNYDSQFELSYVGFIGSENHKDNYDDIIETLRINSRSTNKNEAQFSNPKLIKLNGSTDYSYNNTKKSVYNIDSLHNAELFEEIFQQVKELKGCSFNFAWESDTKEDIRVKSAKNIITKTNVLVIIGYTFPYYNMETDKAIFGGKRFDKVYIQDLPHQHEGLIEKLEYLGVTANSIKGIKHTDLFFIPPEYIGRPPKQRMFITA